MPEGACADNLACDFGLVGAVMGGGNSTSSNELNYDRFDQTIDYMYDEMMTNIDSKIVDNIKEDLYWGRELIAKIRWTSAVHSNGKWNHKPKIDEMFELEKADDCYFPFRGDNTSEWYYDIWSNIHYGYVGSAAGFDAKTLQDGAGIAWFAGRNDKAYILSIQIGIDLWNDFENALTQRQLINAILSNRENYLNIQRDDENINFILFGYNGK